MFSRLSRIVLWKYADDVPIDKLHRYYRIATWIIRIGCGAAVLMVSSLAEFIFSRDGVLRDITMIILLASCTLCMFLLFPSVLTVAWANEIENTLKERGFPLIEEKKKITLRVGISAMKVCFWFIVIIVGVNLFHRR